MATILTYEIMQNYRPCSNNNKARITQIIKEVERLELGKRYGIDVYNAMVTDANTSPLAEDVSDILQNGLYEALSFFVYAQYTIESQVADTFTGMVTKSRPDSENVPVGTLRNLQTYYKELANLALEQVNCLILNKYKGCESVPKGHNVQIYNIGKKTRRNGRGIDFDTTYFE